MLGSFCCWLRAVPETGRQREQLSSKVFVITGASSGLGRGIALEAGRCKAIVVLASRNRLELNKVAAEIEAAGGRALVLLTDVSSDEQMASLADTVSKRFGRIDIWINNAGVAMKQFILQGSGVLINIASVESNISTAYQAAYSASKAGVQNIGNTRRQELRLNGYKKIRVVTILPYALDTPLWDHAATYIGHAPRMMALDPACKAVNVPCTPVYADAGQLLWAGRRKPLWPRGADRIGYDTQIPDD
ncbi:SDR family NAD(P)-dependent oxidoreductase [Taibaiella koreensis]|uniref:SDR family NAD(P)-dependent oxidoreductase n=1 Tax=Taibaiella koreensis TaxID=1268548 RepID=UPI000E59ECD6|nr:SDR family NAD(P)-dependent oxidoreductase [Taibaiella koreensis]